WALISGNLEANSSDLQGFRKRCYQWLDAFQLMKFLHFRRDQGQFNIPVEEAALQLLNWTGNPYDGALTDTKAILRLYRALDRASPWWANGNRVAVL
ncbi:MAG: hypothetical protein AAF598_15030, partial [Bacteroidota bacterium]